MKRRADMKKPQPSRGRRGKPVANGMAVIQTIIQFVNLVFRIVEFFLRL